MSPDQITELPVIECLPFRKGKPGFALPLLAHPEYSDLRFVQQVDEYRNFISGFKILEDYALGDAIPVNGPLAAVGGDLVHVFVTENGLPYAGKLNDLCPVMDGFISRHPNEHAVILQIKELVGSDQEKKVARLTMRENIVRSAGASAAGAFYEGDTLRSALWGRLLNFATDAESAARILAVRPRLSATIQQDGSIKLDIGALDVRDAVRIDQEVLRAELLAEFAPLSSDQTSQMPHHDIKPDNILQTEQVSDLLRKISHTARQEARIAILADSILRDRETGMSALVQYKEDRAKFATWALHELRSSLLFNQNRSASMDDEVIANLIPRFFTKAFPLSRGDLLYHLAWHLAKWPKINAAIGNSLNKTRSMFVDFRRKEIEELLDKPRGR
jgi:hypothetical protein